MTKRLTWISGAACLTLTAILEVTRPTEAPPPVVHVDAGAPDGGSTMIAAEPVWRASLLAAECTHTGEYNALCEVVAPSSGAP